MTNLDLAQSYLLKVRSRLKILDVLLAEADFSNVIREAQEIVEQAEKAAREARFVVELALKIVA